MFEQGKSLLLHHFMRLCTIKTETGGVFSSLHQLKHHVEDAGLPLWPLQLRESELDSHVSRPREPGRHGRTGKLDGHVGSLSTPRMRPVSCVWTVPATAPQPGAPADQHGLKNSEYPPGSRQSAPIHPG